MKKIILLNIVLVIFLVACKSSKDISVNVDKTTNVSKDTIVIANKELDYEIIILEQGFDRYLNTQPKEDYYGITFLENKNIFYVQEYNRRVRDITISRDLYPQEINYDRNKRYGKQVNFLLYNYFQFFEKKYNQRLK